MGKSRSLAHRSVSNPPRHDPARQPTANSLVARPRLSLVVGGLKVPLRQADALREALRTAATFPRRAVMAARRHHRNNPLKRAQLDEMRPEASKGLPAPTPRMNRSPPKPRIRRVPYNYGIALCSSG